jgi:uncharacterized protein YecT (DUF1311 family)
MALALAAAPQSKSYEQIKAKSAAEVAQADMEMNLQFQLALKRLGRCPANTVKCYYWKKAVPRLRREQAAWIQWRDAKSDLDAVEMEGTSGETEVRNYFKVQMTKARAAELSKIGRH